MPSAVSHVFELTELQDCIFEYLDKGEQAKCARVCKGWTNAAVYRLWNELDSVVPLLRVLGEFTADGRALSVGLVRKTARTTTYSLTFSGEPSDERWARFRFYAALISTIRLSNYSNYDYVPLFTHTSPVQFGRAVLRIISNGQKHPRLLPNVVNLHVDASVDASVFSLATLLFGRLKGLELVVDVTPHKALSWTPLKRFLTNMLSLSPDLQCFSIKATPGATSRWHGESLTHHSELDQIIRDYLLHMRTSLTTVKVNSTLFTPELFDMLSNFPCIRSIQNSGRRAYHTPKPLQISLRISDGAFPALKSLFLPIEANSGVTVFAMLGHTLENLTSLSVVCLDYLSSLKCHGLIVAMSQSCPSLLSLEVIACTSRNAIGGHTNATAQWWEDNSGPTSRESRMECLSLAPLFELHSLKELTLQLDFVLPITDLELEQALSRRRIPFDVLQLSWTPRRFDIDRPNLTLKALDIIAHHCPTIRILSIFIMVEDTSFVPCSSFRCLEELNTGLSIIPPHLLNQTAAILCKLFRDCLPEFSASQHTGHFDKCQIDAERARGVLENYKKWEKVIRIINKSKGVVNVRELCRFARSERRVFYPSVENRIPGA